MNGFKEFEFNLAGALKSELIQLLDGMQAAPLTPECTEKVPDAQGVYLLFYGGKLVYVGKSDAKRGLRTRLSRHAKKLMHRPTLTSKAQFKAVRVMVFTAMDLEAQLIDHYRRANKDAATWNGSGFGSNDPGRRRETTNKDFAPEGFDKHHPIDIDIPGEYLPAGTVTVAEALKNLSAVLPYTLRYETEPDQRGRAHKSRPHPDLKEARVNIPKGPQTVRQLMKAIMGVLDARWQATVFASHVILYVESTKYQFGKAL